MNPPFDRCRLIAVGFRRWKAYSLYPLLRGLFREVVYVPDAAAAEKLGLTENDCVAAWGIRGHTESLQRLSAQYGIRFLRIEDGFIRSVGLGSDLIAPVSLVLDSRGIYFDPSQPSDLTCLLNHGVFGEDELQRAEALRRFIVETRLTKYNIDTVAPPAWADKTGGRKTVLVPGQVETDASIRLGGCSVKTNLELLQAARAAEPDAFIVYKPHPDVLAKNRKGGISRAAQYADAVETESSVVSLLEVCDSVHTITSLTGFDALLRQKSVTVYGRPFYAGWGLTDDRAPFSDGLRQQKHTLQELAAAALLRYPVYFDWETRRPADCETVLQQLVRQRDMLHRTGAAGRLKHGFFRRQGRKISVLARAFATRWQK